jgi:integrase
MLLDEDAFTLSEKKTGKRRTIRINKGFQNHIKDCYNALKIQDRSENCFLSNKKCVYSIQRVNVIFKEIKSKYNLKIEHFSTHSLRKTFGHRVVESAGENSEMALIKLSELFNHSSPQITRRYLGLRHEELMEVYTSLSF